MSERKDTPSSADTTPSAREQRLAEALRANLRRRKAPSKKSAPDDPSP